MIDQEYQTYVDFFTEVYKTMNENYYFPLKREDFARFVLWFKSDFYPRLKASGQSKNYLCWRSSALLVERLKDPKDIFSAFMPPSAAKEFEGEVLGKKFDLGIVGALSEQGYAVSFIEPRSDAFENGLREADVLLAIDDKPVSGMEEKDIADLLTPLEGSTVTLRYLDSVQAEEKVIDVLSKEYFKQTVFLVPVDVPGIFCLQIQRFNRKTSEDMTRFMSYILENEGKGIIIDLRGNPGGPPLAAREISAFFLTPNDEFAYFQKKNRPKAQLFVPEIPAEYRFAGDVAILVDKKSGSASELFSGILQRRGRAVLMGTNTAGQVLLKSMFYFDDDSMVLLVTARGHHPDGEVFPFAGVAPDEQMEDSEVDLISYAAEYLSDK